MKLDSIARLAAVLLLWTLAPIAAPSKAESQEAPAEAAMEEAAAPSLAADLDRYLHGLTGEGFSGSVLLVRDGETIVDAGYGHLGSVAMRTDTRYWLASISKQFTAAAVLKLAEEGKLKLDDRIDRYLEEVPKKKSEITLRHLLSHTSGLPQAYAADDVSDPGEAAMWILASRLKHPVGRKFSYSNDNYSLAAIIVERVSGRPFEAFLTERLLEPAGMRDTGFWDSDEWEEVAPTVEELAFLRGSNWGLRGGNGMFSTTGDLLRWWGALDSDRVLSETGRKELLAARGELSSGGQYAYGWFLSETAGGRRRLWTRGTEDFGANAILDVYPDDGVVLVALSHAGGPEPAEGEAETTFTRMIRSEVESLLFDERP